MLDRKHILDHIKPEYREFIEDVQIRSYDDTILLYIPLNKISHKVQKNFTSQRQINNIKKHISERFTATVNIIVTVSSYHSNLEKILLDSLNRKNDNLLISLTISFHDLKSLNSWIEVKTSTHKSIEKIQKDYNEILNSMGLFSLTTQWISTKNDYPTYTAILRVIKIKQPIPLELLAKELEPSYGKIEHKWLANSLDKLRRNNKVHWQKNGSYVLTTEALATVPSGTHRKSSDIERALALSRKKW
ncbi:MAG: hypothetical protein VX185_05980 [Pseudomonadota bacterium]|nr:hypothetical protein [Pseudomonadota bacterium]